jgi:thiol-disulfide isomerase/thioredoxin
MNRKLQTVLIGTVALLCAVSGVWFYQSSRADRPPDATAAGNMVLGAKLMGVDDQVHPFEQWRGKVLIVNFWATWCAPCREEIPGFVKFQQAYGPAGLQFVGIAIDQKPRVIPYAQEMGINYPLLVGGLETMDFARQLGNRMSVLPFTLVLDRTGKVVLSEVGILQADKLEKTVKPLL